MPAEPRFCRFCGHALAAGAHFCDGCGAEVAPARTTDGGARRVPRRALAGGGLAALLAVAAVAVGAIVLRGDGSGTPPPGPASKTESTVTLLEKLPDDARGADGFPLRAHSLLTHPSGATVDVPGGEVLFGTTIDLQLVHGVDLGPARRGDGRAWRFFSNGGLAPSGAIRLTLPAGSAPADALVAVLAPTGTWIGLPTQREGDNLVATITDAPSGWLVTVAARVATTEPSDRPSSAVAEELYWSDRAAWNESESAWLAEQDLSVADPSDSSLTASARPAAAGDYLSFTKNFDDALRMLGATRLSVIATAIPGAALPSAVGGAQYRAGIAKLAKARKDWVANRDHWASENGYEGDYSKLVWTADDTVQQALETALAEYAPWGVELTNNLARTNGIADLDLRVLAPYGDLLFADVKIGAGAATYIDKEIAKVKTGATGREENRFLRFYSTRAIESTSLIDYLKDWKTEAFVRYLPVALWGAGLIEGGPILLTVAAADQAINLLQAEYEQEQPYMYAKLDALSAGVGAGDFVVDATRLAVRSGSSGWTSVEAGSTAFGAAQFIYSASLAYAVASTDWYMLKDVRGATEGTQAYCVRSACNSIYAQGVPPIQIIASVRGPAVQAADLYPATRTKIMAWNLGYYGQGIALNLHRELEEGWREATQDGTTARTTADVLNGENWNQYSVDNWPDRTVSEEPQAQAMRFAIPKTYLRSIESQYAVKPDSPVADYGLQLRIEAADGSRNLFTLTEAAQPLPTDSKDFVYVNAILTTPDAPQLDGLQEAYRGEVQVADGKRLRVAWQARIQAFDQDEKEWLNYSLEFDKDARLVSLDQEDAAAARVHYKDAAPDPTSDLIYRFTKFAVSGESMTVGNFLGAYIHPTASPTAVCQSAPTTCYFAILGIASEKTTARVPFICTEAGLAEVKKDAVAALTDGSCTYVGGVTQASSGGIPAMYITLTPTTLKSESGGTIGTGPDSQHNIMTWIVLNAALTPKQITGTMDLTDYDQYKSDGVWTPDYNEKGPIPLSPPHYATVTFEGVRVN